MPVYIDGFPMDLAVSETHGFESEATSHPVEVGADVTDHIRNLPVEIELECIVSDSPIGAIASDPTRQPAGSERTLPSEEAYARLQAARAARKPITIETSLGTFKSMALISLSVPRSRETTGGLFFTARLRKLEIVETKRVTVAIPNAKRSTSYGHKAAKKAASRTILWRKGRPPGLGPDTTPPGEIIGQQVITVKDGAYLYEDDSPLETADLQALSKDLARDGTRSPTGKVKGLGDQLQRADALTKARKDNPGKHLDPALFGLY